MRVGLLTEGGYPYPNGAAGQWCDRLVRELAQHEFEVCALSRGAAQEAGGWLPLPTHVRRVRTAPLWGEPAPEAPATTARAHRRRERALFAEHFGRLARAISAATLSPELPDPPFAAAPSADVAPVPARAATAPDAMSGQSAARRSESQADRFATVGQVAPPLSGPRATAAPARRSEDYAVPARAFADGLYGLAELAREHGGLSAMIRSDIAARLLEVACRAPGATGAAHRAGVADLLTVQRYLERALRPLSLPWYGEDGPRADAGREGADAGRGLSGVDLCHATSAGPAVLPGLLAKRFFGTPLLVTEHGTRLREHYLDPLAPDPAAPAHAPASAPVRTLIASFHRQLAAEAYAQAALVTAGSTHTRRWQERCGADPTRVRTLYPGLDARRFDVAREHAVVGADDGRTLVWVGRVEPTRDLVCLLHAFAEVRREEPGARLRIVDTGPVAPGEEGAIADCPPDTADVDAAAPALAMAYAAVATGGGTPAHAATAWAAPYGAPCGTARGGPGSAAVARGGPPHGRRARAPRRVWRRAVRAGARRSVTRRERRAGAIGGGAPWFAGATGGDGLRASRPVVGALTYRAQCAALAAQLFPDEAPHAHAIGASPVSFEALGGWEAPTVPEAYAAGSVVVRSSVAEGFPTGLVEAMLCERATVSTDVGAVSEVVGGTGLLVPPRNPRALAAACLTLLRDPARRERLGGAARSRALELFDAQRNTGAYRGIYLELLSRAPVRRAEAEVGAAGDPLPFAYPAEARVPGHWTASGRAARTTARTATGRATPRWAAARAGGADPEPGACASATPAEVVEAPRGRMRKREGGDEA
ncbi:DUF3492 domain-containing protein [Streptomyces sp. NPDC057702]|uniref:DUF3492 domain-containing protein n=1 Tax=unclassified Streptomyces TaxID=2593676 RepID=UPI003699F824